MNEVDLHEGLALSTAAGWNQTLKDWQLIHAQHSKNNWVATHGNRIIGTAMTIVYHAAFEWVGMVLVEPVYRRQGLGKKLMQKIIDHRTCRHLKLDASEMGLGLYQHFGFRVIQEIFRNVAHSPVPHITNYYPDIIAINEHHLASILAFDLKHTGINRAQLLADILDRGSGYVWIRENAVMGYVLARNGSRYYQVGPLMATSTDHASILLDRVLDKKSSLPVCLDVICKNLEFSQSLLERGFRKERTLIRMQLGDGPDVTASPTIFGILDPAMG